MRRSGSGSRGAQRYTARAGGLGIVPSGACRTARCSLHWCRRGSSRLHPVVPGSAARAEPRPKRPRMPRWGAERRARPLHFLRSRWPRSSPTRRKGERARAASLFDAARWCAYRRSASLLSREEFFGNASWLGFSWRRQSSDAKGHRDNGKARHRAVQSLTSRARAAATARSPENTSPASAPRA